MHIGLHKQGDLPKVISFQSGSFCDDSDELYTYILGTEKECLDDFSKRLVILICIKERQNVSFT